MANTLTLQPRTRPSGDSPPRNEWEATAVGVPSSGAWSGCVDAKGERDRKGDDGRIRLVLGLGLGGGSDACSAWAFLDNDGDGNPPWSWPPGVDLAALGLDTFDVAMEGGGGAPRGQGGGAGRAL